MAEHAEEALGAGIDELASFITDTPETEPEDDNEAADTPPAENADTEDESANADEQPEEDAPPETPPSATHKVIVKGEDGADTEVNVSTDELVKGYQRQADYTRKSQELSRREAETTQALAQRHDEYRNHYLQQADMAIGAVMQIAGLKSPQEMETLARDDPAAWVTEQQRQANIRQVIGHIQQQGQMAMQQRAQEMDAQLQRIRNDAWTALNADGLNREAVEKLYDRAMKAGVKKETLGNIYDAEVVRLMRDGMAFRDLQSKRSEVTRKVEQSPRLPSKQPMPQAAARDKALSQKFQSGNAKLKDLAAFLTR